MKILDLLKLTDDDKFSGVWLSEKEGEGEYKEWWEETGNLWEHSLWKKGKKYRVIIRNNLDGTLRKRL